MKEVIVPSYLLLHVLGFWPIASTPGSVEVSSPPRRPNASKATTRRLEEKTPRGLASLWAEMPISFKNQLDTTWSPLVTNETKFYKTKSPLRWAFRS